jgi:hypothetical protein
VEVEFLDALLLIHAEDAMPSFRDDQQSCDRQRNRQGDQRGGQLTPDWWHDECAREHLRMVRML